MIIHIKIYHIFITILEFLSFNQDKHPNISNHHIYIG